MAQPGKISLADFAQRHPELARGDPMLEEPEPCPICGYPNCTDPAEHARRLALEAEAKEAKRPRAPAHRRDEKPVTVDREPIEDLDRLVVAQEDCYEDVVPPGCIDSVSILRITAGQRLPKREALELGIGWTEQGEPDTFEVTHQNGVPVILDRGGLHWEDGPRVLRAHYEGDE
jgi:hypothetical protein